MFEDLAGGVAVVTGGARGLGFSMAAALARAGVQVALLDLLPELADSAGRIAADHGVRTTSAQVDVTSQEQLAGAMATVTAALGPPGILVNAAGIAVWHDSLDVSAQDWRRVLDVNLTGTFLACQAFGRGCRERGSGGAVVNISSMSATVVNVPQQQAAYNTSKAGVDMVTRSLAVEWAAAGIRVNAIAPGYFLSDMTRQFTEANPELAREWVGRIPLGRMGEPGDLDGLVTFLCSSASGYLTGQSIVIDGGYTLV